MKCSVKSFTICNLHWRPLLLCTPVHLYYHFFGLEVKKSLKKSQKVSKSKSRSLKWHQLFLPSFGADGHIYSRALGIFNFATIGAKILKLCEIIAVHFLRSNSKLILSPCDKETNAGFSL